jgi:hypothetical protein
MEGHTTDPGNSMIGETCRRQGTIEASFEGDQCPERAGWMIGCWNVSYREARLYGKNTY